MTKFKIIVLSLISVFAAFYVFAADDGGAEKIKFLPDTMVVLPMKSKVKFNWLVPPQELLSARNVAKNNICFSVDAKGNPWFSRDNQILLNAGENFMFKLEVPFVDFVFLGDGALLFSTGKYLGFIPKLGKNVVEDKDGISTVPFQPLASLPADSCKLFPGCGDILYITGNDPKTGEDEVFTLGGNNSLEKAGEKGSVLSYKKIFAAEKHITAAAGDGKTTYAAFDRLIVEITKGKDTINVFFSHPKENITGIVFGKKGGLFYSTESFIGYAGNNGNIDFMKIQNAKLSMQNNKLYVFLPDTYGVLVISNIDDFKNYNFHIKQKSGAEK